MIASEEGNAQVYAYDLQAPIVLGEGIEMLLGMNDIPLLYVEQGQNYIRLSPLGADIMRMLLEKPNSLTPAALEEALAARYPGREAEVREKLARFLQQLHTARVITLPGTAPREPVTERVLRRVAYRPMLRLGLWRPRRPLAYHFVRRFACLSGDTTQIILTLWLMAAAICTGYALVKMGTSFQGGGVLWPLVIGLFLLHLVLHELSHTLVSSYYDVKIREIGVALLYYFFPVAYADRTDGYRLRVPKQRIYISLAGPAFDLSAAALSGLLALSTGGWLGNSLHALMFFEFAMFISNLNPLMPSDGYHALEALFGELNFRHRAFRLLFSLLTLRKLPAQLSRLTWRQKALYLGYGLLACAYVSLLAFFMFKLITGVLLGSIVR